jgi:CRP-like cAMP-binding protein
MAKPVRNRSAPAKEDNQLLAALDAGERRLLQPRLEPVGLALHEVLFEPGQEIGRVYFVRKGLVATVRGLRNGSGVAVASIGSEGMVGIPLVLGERTMASRLLVQVAGDALRVEAHAFRTALEQLPTLRRILQRYALVLLRQLAQTAACNQLHTVDERCAKWLLLTHDRVGAPRFALTQEFFAQLLGVHRAAVSPVAGMLHRAGVITYIRGTITILDRAGLEAASCECYRVISAEYHKLLGPLRASTF